jgi:serine/threonine protein kinase
VSAESQPEKTRAYIPKGSFVPPTPEELTSRLPNLEVSELLGHGGMGVVYKGRQPFLDRNVAIKLVRPDLGMDADAQQRFIREARSLAKLVHPYIVTVFDFGKVGELYYLVMEYVEGNSLRQLISRQAVTPRNVLEFAPQIGAALQHAHESGIVHRDVKPDNILVDARNRVRLVDFGLAKLLGVQGQPNPDDQTIAGTLGYMAPEQLSMPERVDHRADIYSAGVVLYEMLTGKIPARAAAATALNSVPDLRFDPIVHRALEKDREKRYQQIREMNDDLIAVTRLPETTVHLQQTVRAPVEQVFAAWITPEQMTDWFAPTDDYSTPIAEVDLQVGGRFKLAMKHKDKEFAHIACGQFCRIQAPYFLQLTWAWEAPNPSPFETQLTVEFRPNGNATDVTLIHERFWDERTRKDHNEGWTGCLNRLAQKLPLRK